MSSLAIMTRKVIPTNQVIPISPTISISILANLLRIASQNLEVQRSKLNLTMTINQLEIMQLHLLPLWERKQDRSAHLIMQNDLLCLDQQKDSFGRLFGENMSSKINVKCLLCQKLILSRKIGSAHSA